MSCAHKKAPARFVGRALGHETPRILERNFMRSVRNRAPVRNHHDLPLFRFAARVDDLRRMSYADRYILKAARLRCASTARLIADLAGYQRGDAC